MTNSTAAIKVNVTRRFDRDCKVFAFDVRVDNEVYREVSKNKAFMLIMQAQEVADDLDMMCNVYGMDYLRAA
ncbi:hypothetical protein GH789_04790 [Rhizobium pusense]|uniref:hypothetical protein n=1 Tax=Agrobacterium pusense TaxID=648995 RepID=UPI00129BE1DC|nr:hypothetical protein [Agrobacterium pusense]MRG64601.1 hypothetical protein [Agrobacterium pusense]